jgi:hypothetical protein
VVPSRDTEIRVLEQFLRTMAPPAALTAVYRQRVVRSLLEAREQMLSRRRKEGWLLAALGVACAFVLSVSFSALTSHVPMSVLSRQRPEALVETMLTSPQISVDGYESALIQTHVQIRLQAWIAAQRAGSSHDKAAAASFPF